MSLPRKIVVCGMILARLKQGDGGGQIPTFLESMRKVTGLCDMITRNKSVSHLRYCVFGSGGENIKSLDNWIRSVEERFSTIFHP